MKGIGLIGMLLALLIFAYILMQRLNQPAPETAALGKAVPLVDAPAAVRAKLDSAMQKESDRIQNMDAEGTTP